MILCITVFAAITFMVQGFAPSNVGYLSSIKSAVLPSTSSVIRMVAVDTSEIKTGMTIELDGEPHKILSFSIMKQAKAVARTTIRFKNLMRGTTVENTYISGKKLETATIDRKPGQYTYSDENGNYFFMDTETFEEVMVDAKVMEDCKKWIVDGMTCNLVFFKGNVIECVVPNPFVYQIVETEPNMKGNTASGYTKPATLSCGAVINIPGFVEQGTMIKVDIEKSEYLGRE